MQNNFIAAMRELRNAVPSQAPKLVFWPEKQKFFVTRFFSAKHIAAKKMEVVFEIKEK